MPAGDLTGGHLAGLRVDQAWRRVAERRCHFALAVLAPQGPLPLARPTRHRALGRSHHSRQTHTLGPTLRPQLRLLLRKVRGHTPWDHFGNSSLLRELWDGYGSGQPAWLPAHQSDFRIVILTFDLLNRVICILVQNKRCGLQRFQLEPMTF